MEIELKDISFKADLYEVKSEFSRILHSENFRRTSEDDDQEQRLMNFQITLGESPHRRHDGTGMLTLPSRAPGQKLLQLAREGRDYPLLHSRRIRMRDSGMKPNRATVETLRKLPYQDPNIDRERDDILFKLGVSWRVDKLQLGLWLRHPARQRRKGCPSVFAVEWEKDYATVGNAQLAFEYDRKLLRIRLGDPFLDDEAHNVVIKFTNIQQMWTGYEFKPYICFDLLTPAIFESEWFNRMRSGVAFEDTKKIRQRVGALDDHHRRIEPYAHQIRVILYQEKDLKEFRYSCTVAGLRKPMMANIISEGHDFFSQKLLLKVRKSYDLLRGLPWTTSFQIEGLLHNGLLTTTQLLDSVLPYLTDLANSHPAVIGTLLRDYAQGLFSSYYDYNDSGDIAKHFREFCKNRLEFTSLITSTQATQENEGLIACHHVTFTATRILLEGPYPIQSNRVLRRYNGFHDHFLRVDFRDEDRLQFRWEHEVDGTTLLNQRVGETLKNGFDLAGRHFEFLAYSSSALREHAVWFVSPFLHPSKGLVNAASIRKEEGDFSGDLSFPSKFAARLALAFTATVPSVKIAKDQWREIPDLGVEPYLHTDGVGTISRELGRLMWLEFRKFDPNLERQLEPCAYQIRFLGYKGVLVIDDQLGGVQMCLRPSMSKFKAYEVDVANIEIAKAFYIPNTLYLNRPLVMLLEDQGAKKEAFINLLHAAIADVRLACDSVKHLVAVMKKHALGSTFGLSSLLQKLASCDLDIDPRIPAKNLRTPFMDKLIDCAVASVLRDIQYRCRIPVPQGYQLVGVADEGPAYIERGEFSEDEVFILQEGEIFACIQRDPNSEREYLYRTCIVTRSPTLYPGDVQRVFAVGKPPENKICAFRNLVNVIVFPSKGERSLPSCLSGGDLDGDVYDICQYHPIFGNLHGVPAEFPPVPKWEIDLTDLEEVNPKTGETMVDQEKIIPYVCDFVVEYINSAVLGMLATNHLVRADQSSEGVRDKGCLVLAKLCSQAVDYPKNGMPVDITNTPRRLIPYDPDWKKGEAHDERRTDFYRSERAIGEIFRIAEKACSYLSSEEHRASVYVPVLEHPVYLALNSTVKSKLRNPVIPKTTVEQVRKLFSRYYEELGYICTTHTLTDHVGARLKEEEVVVGTILAQCSQHRWRKERMYRMRLHAMNLEKEVKGQFIPKKMQEMSTKEVKESLEFAWTSWKLITDKLATPDAQTNSFGLNSFSFIALNVVFECLEYLDRPYCRKAA